MNSIYDNNLNALKEYRLDIYEAIIAEDFTYDDSYIKSDIAKNGEVIIYSEKDGNKVYLNSRYNPTIEAQKYMEEYKDMPEKSNMVIFGISNCMFIRAFINNNTKEAKCFTYEPDRAIFMCVLKNIDITDIIANEDITLSIDGVNDKWMYVWLLSNIVNYNRSTNKYITLPKYGILYKQQCDEFVKSINDAYDTLKMEENTITRMGKTACKNSILNMRFLENSRSAVDYRGKFPENMPGIVVSAGPSLSKNVDLLKKAKGKALIICTDTAIDKVVSTGIYPDMVISVDYIKPLRLFKAKDLNKVPFLADVDLNTEVIEFLKPKTLIYYVTDNLGYKKILDDVGASDNFYTVSTGGSVATGAIGMLIGWGFKKIILIGQDLAFTDNKIHVDSDEKYEFDEYNYLHVKGINGDMLPVSKDYYNYLKWIESIALINDDVEIIDATEGGSLKENTTVMTFNDAIDKYCKESYDIKKIIENAPKHFSGDNFEKVKERFKAYIKELKSLEIKLKKASSDCIMAAHMLKNKDNNREILKDINRYIKKVDEALLTSDTSVYIYKYTAKAEYDFGEDMYIEEENDIDESIRLYTKCTDYYKELADGIPEIVEIMEKTLLYLEKDI